MVDSQERPRVTGLIQLQHKNDVTSQTQVKKLPRAKHEYRPNDDIDVDGGGTELPPVLDPRFDDF